MASDRLRDLRVESGVVMPSPPVEDDPETAHHHSVSVDALISSDLTRRLRTLAELQEAMDEVNDAAYREIVSLRDASPRTAFAFTLDVATHRRRPRSAEGHPVLLRTVYDSEVLRFPRAGEVLQARHDGGEQFRFVTNAPFSVTIADDLVAVLDLTSYDSSGEGSLLIRERRHLAGLKALVEDYWRQAIPMSFDGLADLDKRSRQVLSLLAAGASDAVISKQAGLSIRTVERTVAALLDRLGARTRFQAGVQAARRGWI